LLLEHSAQKFSGALNYAMNQALSAYLGRDCAPNVASKPRGLGRQNRKKKQLYRVYAVFMRVLKQKQLKNRINIA
jgi:hypothetical protein